MSASPLHSTHEPIDEELDDDGPQISLVDLLTWLGEGKRLVGAATVIAGGAALAVALSMPPTYTARTTMLPPASQQQSASAAAVAALSPDDFDRQVRADAESLSKRDFLAKYESQLGRFTRQQLLLLDEVLRRR